MSEILAGFEQQNLTNLNKNLDASKIQDKKIFLFQVSKDFDPSILAGQQINLKSQEIQDLDLNEQSFQVQLIDKQTQEYLNQQIVPLIPSKAGFQILKNKKFDGIYKINKKFTFGHIKKKSLIKTKPIQFK